MIFQNSYVGYIIIFLIFFQNFFFFQLNFIIFVDQSVFENLFIVILRRSSIIFIYLLLLDFYITSFLETKIILGNII